MDDNDDMDDFHVLWCDDDVNDGDGDGDGADDYAGADDDDADVAAAGDDAGASSASAHAPTLARPALVQRNERLRRKRQEARARRAVERAGVREAQAAERRRRNGIGDGDGDGDGDARRQTPAQRAFVQLRREQQRQRRQLEHRHVFRSASLHVGIDCAYDALQVQRELTSLSTQINAVYTRSRNGFFARTFATHLFGVSDTLRARLRVSAPDSERWVYADDDDGRRTLEQYVDDMRRRQHSDDGDTATAPATATATATADVHGWPLAACCTDARDTRLTDARAAITAVNDAFADYYRPSLCASLMRDAEPAYAHAARVDRVVYLSPDADSVLERVDAHTLYVCGGLIDRSRKSGASAARARELGVHAARLPLARYCVEHASAGPDSVLCVDGVVELLALLAHYGNDWTLALRHYSSAHSGKLRVRDVPLGDLDDGGGGDLDDDDDGGGDAALVAALRRDARDERARDAIYYAHLGDSGAAWHRVPLRRPPLKFESSDWAVPSFDDEHWRRLIDRPDDGDDDGDGNDGGNDDGDDDGDDDDEPTLL